MMLANNPFALVSDFLRPEVLGILRDYYAGLSADENVEVKLAGHSAR